MCGMLVLLQMLWQPSCPESGRAALVSRMEGLAKFIGVLHISHAWHPNWPPLAMNSELQGLPSNDLRAL